VGSLAWERALVLASTLGEAWLVAWQGLVLVALALLAERIRPVLLGAPLVLSEQGG